MQEAAGEEVLVGVTSLLAADPKAADIRDVKGPEEPPLDWRPYAVLAGAVAVLALAVAGLYLALNRPRRERTVPPPPAHEVAFAALERVRRQDYVGQEQFGAYFVELTRIVRRYLEDGFRLRAPGMTTEEFLTATASDPRLAAGHRRLLADFLAQADLVKFARVVPTLPEHRPRTRRPAPKATAYERSKQAADRIVTEALAEGLPAVFLHPSGIYGPGPTTSPGTNQLIADLVRGKVPMLLPGGIPVVHYDDAARGHLLAERAAAVGARYILSESYHSLLDVARRVRATTGTSKVPPVMPLALARVVAELGERLARWTKRAPLLPSGQLTFLQYEARPVSRRAERELGWMPRPFAQGLAETIEFLRGAGRC